MLHAARIIAVGKAKVKLIYYSSSAYDLVADLVDDHEVVEVVSQTCPSQ